MRQQIMDILNKMEPVYMNALRGDPSAFSFDGIFDEKLGMVDANRRNRLALGYYMLFSGNQEETVASFLFSEEVKAIKSVGEITANDCLDMLTFILQKFNEDRRYDILFDRLRKNRLGHFEDYDVYKQQKMLDEYNEDELRELIEKLK